MVLDHADEKGRFTAGNRGAHELQGGVLGVLHIRFGDVFVLQHLVQHAIAGLRGALRAAVGGGIVVGRADDSGEKGAFGELELEQVLSEERNAGFGKAEDAKTAAIAEINFVGVELENFLLGEALFEIHANHGFGEVAPPGALIREEESARDLHGDGAGALIVLAGMANVGPGGAGDADEVESAMLEKAFVFGGENGMNQGRRQIVVAGGAAFVSRAIKQIADQRRFDFRGVQTGAAGERADGADAPCAELHGKRIGAGKVGKLGGTDIYGAAVYLELPGGAGIFLRTVAYAG